jgi:hypothetical protein
MSIEENKLSLEDMLVQSRHLLEMSNQQIIVKSKRDHFFKEMVEGFKASIQFKTPDDLINAYMVFDGNVGIEYFEGKLENPDATVIYHSVEDLYILYTSFGDITEGLVANRFEMKGNLNVLFRYGFLVNYINPKLKKLKH